MSVSTTLSVSQTTSADSAGPAQSPTVVTPRKSVSVRHAAQVERGVQLAAKASIPILRTSMGAVFLGFGALKFVPGLSPAEPLVVRTVDALTFGLVGGNAALLLTAVLECFIGLTLISGRLLRVGLAALAMAMVGILSPLVLFASDMFGNGPTLEAQYILKDVVLCAAALVIAVHTLGARLVLPAKA